MDKLILGRQEIAAAADTSLSIVDDAIAAGHLETFLFGRKRKATLAAVQKWITYIKAESDAGRPVCYRARGNRKAAA